MTTTMGPFFEAFCEPHLPALRHAGGWAAQFEFSVRMSAAALFGGSESTAKDLAEMFDRVVEELRPHLTAEHLDDLISVGLCQLRHDILHCRLSKAYGKLGGKANDPSIARVMKFDDSLPPVDQLVKGIVSARPIPHTSTVDGTIPAWLAQAGQMRIFQAAADAFERAYEAMQAGMEVRARRGLEEALGSGRTG